jgi:uncharacterized protein (DUF1800 family)
MSGAAMQPCRENVSRNKVSKDKLLAVCLLGLLAVVAAPFALGKKKDKHNSASQMDAQKQILHALNRLTFGPKPGDVQRVSSIGLEKWIDEQLRPEKIDDSALEARLQPLRTLRMDTREIAENFPPPELIRAVANGKQPMPADPAKHAIYMAQLEKYEEKTQKKQEAAAPNAPAPTPEMTPAKANDEQMMERQEQHADAESKARELMDLPPDQRFKAVLKLSSDEPAALASLKGEIRENLTQDMNPQQRETVQALNNPQQVVVQELTEAKLLRAIYSERQLQEVMDDFWLNHFNVFIGKGADHYLLTNYERDVIRPHALGKFEDLLVATARSPAMLFYLDNWLSVGPNSDAAQGIPKRPFNPGWGRRRFPLSPPRAPRQAKGKRHSGLNENYGRELMELHTLGVNGGYTQKDVTEVARVFTGWTLKEPREGGGFNFDERKHDPGNKTVLGHRIKPHGEKEGLEVLHILAHHPSTAHFVCTKLAMRFVSDTPPRSLVDSMAQTFLKKDGDIREVLKTMLDSPEFWAPEAYRAKVKTPLEFVASAIRASGADVTDATPLARQLQNMGMPLYGMQPPTGYSMKADAWVNSSALLGRMNFALALTGSKLKGIQPQPEVLSGGTATPDAEAILARMESTLLAGDVSKQTHETIAKQVQNPAVTQRKLDDPAQPPDVGLIAGLLLGSPEFQRR